jgi:hypothetical protein
MHVRECLHNFPSCIEEYLGSTLARAYNYGEGRVEDLSEDLITCLVVGGHLTKAVDLIINLSRGNIDTLFDNVTTENAQGLRFLISLIKAFITSLPTNLPFDEYIILASSFINHLKPTYPGIRDTITHTVLDLLASVDRIDDIKVLLINNIITLDDLSYCRVPLSSYNTYMRIAGSVIMKMHATPIIYRSGTAVKSLEKMYERMLSQKQWRVSTSMSTSILLSDDVEALLYLKHIGATVPKLYCNRGSGISKELYDSMVQ